jgi:hypothetical protein
VNIYTVNSPTDMRGAINDACRVRFLAIREAFEPEIRQAWDGIFADFGYMQPNDEPGLIASYLVSIEEPLRDLRSLGMQLVYVTSRGSTGNVPMTMTIRTSSSRRPCATSASWATARRSSICLALSASRGTAPSLRRRRTVLAFGCGCRRMRWSKLSSTPARLGVSPAPWPVSANERPPGVLLTRSAGQRLVRVHDGHDPDCDEVPADARRLPRHAR